MAKPSPPKKQKTSIEKDVEYLRSLPSIRERCQIIYKLAKEDKLQNFSLNESKIPAAVKFIRKVMDDNYPHGIETVLFHSRWRHFEPGNRDRVKNCEAWECDDREKGRRLIDLVLVSVLLDAGAGPTWKYKEPGTTNHYCRSEGLGIASFHMFCEGAFSSNPDNPFQVDAEALKQLAGDSIAKGFQVTKNNPLVGCEGRTALLRRLGQALENNATFFGPPQEAETAGARPGNMIDYLFEQADDDNEISVHKLWNVVIFGLRDMWPEGRTKVGNYNMGDVWPHSKLPQTSETSNLISFHKLSQWLTYSLMEPLKDAGLIITDLSAMTGLPEYRNGGLFIDIGILTPKKAHILVDQLDPSSEEIVEWRALTVVLLDECVKVFREQMGLTEEEFPLVKFLEGGSWKAGRVIAAEKRTGGGPPINIKSDGTVF